MAIIHRENSMRSINKERYITEVGFKPSRNFQAALFVHSAA
jgi:hypothetical protein